MSLCAGFAFPPSVSASYEIAPIFLIRMAGVPFEPIEALATPQVFAAARAFAHRRRQFERAKTAAQDFFRSRQQLLTHEAFRALNAAVKRNRAPVAVEGPQPAFFTDYADAAAQLQVAEASLVRALEEDVSAVRSRLLEFARQFLPRQLIFATGGARELLDTLLTVNGTNGETPPRRNTRLAERERHLLLYLQRICTKNDSFSEFGPTAWGRAVPDQRAVSFAPDPGIARRETFLERWTAHVAAAALNEDPEAFVEFVPRVHPNARSESANVVVLPSSGERIDLSDEEAAVLAKCDGRSSIRALDVSPEIVRRLTEKKVALCAAEVPALDPYAFQQLHADVQRWAPGAARARWLPILESIAGLPQRFADASATEPRREILEDARARLRSIGGEPKQGGRFLYAASNPIGEECVRESAFRIEEDMLQQVADEAAPWIDLWRDSYALIASRVSSGLAGLLKAMPKSSAAVPLPAFLQACENARLSLTGPGLVALAHIAFQEVKAGFRGMISKHLDKAEYVLTADDCHFVRRSFEYPKFDEYTYPSADLQLSARSVEGIQAGDYQWLLAELHPPAAMLHHGAYWSCPDFGALHDALARTLFGRPSFHFGFFAADFTAHTTVRQFDALPELTYFVAPQRCDRKWSSVRPADTEVFLDESSGDVRLRRRDTHEDLGSFARAWVIPLGFHPFYFTNPPHTPRLRCGKVIVQRRSWTVTLDEIGGGDYTGISRDLVLAVERLRAARDLPRYIYIRPTEQALRRSGAEGRDKDTKPVFIDLESYLFLEIFYRWLVKAGELDVTEMLPDPDHLPWQEADGRRTFELRTLVVPRS